MPRLLVLQSPSQRALVIGILSMPKMEQKCDHFVLLSSGKGSQLIFYLPNAHGQKLRDAEPHRKHSIAERSGSVTASHRLSIS
jgi:hypothetical protein